MNIILLTLTVAGITTQHQVEMLAWDFDTLIYIEAGKPNRCKVAANGYMFDGSQPPHAQFTATRCDVIFRGGFQK